MKSPSAWTRKQKEYLEAAAHKVIQLCFREQADSVTVVGTRMEAHYFPIIPLFPHLVSTPPPFPNRKDLRFFWKKAAGPLYLTKSLSCWEQRHIKKKKKINSWDTTPPKLLVQQH